MNNSHIAEDLILIKKTIMGEKEAFGQLIDKYKNSIFRLAFHMMGNYSDAEDISQEVFLQAYRKLKEFKVGSNFHTWLYTIDLNMCKNKLKRRSILKFISIDKSILIGDDEFIREIPDKSIPVEEALIKKEEKEKINKVINTLPLKYRSVFILRYTENMSYEEITKVTKLPLGTVETRLFRARKILMKKFNL